MLERAWRTVATAICFASFGIGGIAIGVLVWPALLLVRDRCRRTDIARRIIRRSFAGFVCLMRGLGVLSLEVRGAQRLARRGLLILPNHPSLIDVVILLALVENGSCIVKAALLRSPFTVGPLRAAGYIANHEGPGLLDDCIAALARGDNLVVFPEGTRSVPGRPPCLLRGAGQIAVRCACPVTPVIIRVSTPTLYKAARMLHVPHRRPHFTVDIRPDLDMALYRAAAKPYSVRARRFTESLQDYYARETREPDPG
jgi:1-acyl-sn-glycerol-3-phosphate acyltransferase